MFERSVLIDLARELEQTAEAGGAVFERKLAVFNKALKSTCDRRTFRDLYKSMEAEDLVDELLAQRDAEAFVPPTTRAELEAILDRRRGLRLACVVEPCD